MKPNFALKLSHDSVEILQRAPAGWIVTGSTRFDAADLDTALARLRAEAEKRDPDGVRTKLILPASEVRYATVLAPGPTDEARRHQIEAEIEGLTPYDLHELAYDFVIEGDHALVAMCAREILSEAEHFAQTHGFNPVSFVAIPQAGGFIGEPFFGETAGARAFLASGIRVQRESEPVRMAGQPQPAAPPAAATPPKSSSPAAAERPPQGPAASAAKPVGELGAASAGAAARAAASVTAAAPEAFSRVGNLVRRMGTRIRREQAQAEPQLPSRTTTTPAAPPAPPASSVSASAARPADPSRALAPETSPHRSVPEKAAVAAPAARWRSDTTATMPPLGKPATPPPAAKWTPPSTTPPRPATASTQPARANTAPSAAQPARASAPVPSLARPTTAEPSDAATRPQTAPVAFASRRSAAPGASGTALVASGPGAPRDKAGPGGRLAVLPAGGDKTDPGRLTHLYRRSRRAAKGALTKIGLLGTPDGKGAMARKSSGHDSHRREAGKADTLQPIVAESRPPVNEKEKASEAESLTIFGARNMQRPEPGFARRGLMLTGGLFLLLIAVAIWAVYFTTSPTRDADIALLPQEETAALPGIVPPARITEPAAVPPAQTPGAVPDPQPIAPALQDIPDDTAIASEIAEEIAPTDIETAGAIPDTQAPVTDPEALLEELVQEALNEALPLEMLGQAIEEAADTVASQPQADATTSAETAFPAADTPQIAPDGDSAPAQQLGLPQQLEPPQVSEVAPVSPPPPPPFGTEFTLGADGLVEATPEGALTPAGVMVYSGRPSEEVPPVRPAALAPVPPASAAPVPEAPPASAAVPADAGPGIGVTEVIMDDTPRADPALAAARPEPRSPRVAAMAAEQTAEPLSAPVQTPQTDPGTAPAPADPGDDSSALAPPPGGVSLDTLRPQQRPTDLVQPTDTAATAETTDIAEADQIAAEAVASSLLPSARPSDLSARIQEALAAVRAPPPAAAAAAAPPAAAAAAPVQTAATAAPNIPSSASVAQQATQARAINLRRVNLIGVFGTPSDRRALVRLSNGQVIRVQVGDTLDGGRVSAIGDDELRYVKNGRNEVLRIGSSG